MLEKNKTWPQVYYETENGERRKVLLQEQMKEHPELEEDKIRWELWKLRYEVKGKDKGPIDYFVRAWMNLTFVGQGKPTGFGADKRKKEIEEIAKSLGYGFGKKYGDLGKNLLYRELYQFMKFIIDIDMRDRSYGNLFLGIGRMSDHKLKEKIAGEFKRFTKEVPESYGLAEDYKMLYQAAVEAFCDTFPSNQSMILS